MDTNQGGLERRSTERPSVWRRGVRPAWRQAEPWKDDTALTARELIPAVLVWFGVLFVCLWVLPILFAAEQAVAP